MEYNHFEEFFENLDSDLIEFRNICHNCLNVPDQRPKEAFYAIVTLQNLINQKCDMMKDYCFSHLKEEK